MGLFLTFILLAAVFVASELLRPKPKLENARPETEFNFPTATQDRVVPLLWGTEMIDGPNVVWYGDLLQEAITQKVKTGLFSSTRIIVGFKYHFGIQFGLCRGPIASLLRIFIGEDEVFNGTQGEGTITINEPDLFGGNELGNGGVVGTVRVHIGTTTQAVNSYLTAFQSVSGATPRYSGTCYCVLEKGYIGNSASSIAPWKFEVRRIPNGLGLGLADVNSGNDANPMNVVYEIITDQEWGYGDPASSIDIANFTAAATTLRNEGNGFSMLLDSAIEASELLAEIERQIDGIVFLDHRSGKWKVKLARADYTIGTVPQLNEDNLIEVVDYSRGAWEDTTNQVRIEFDNRTNLYQPDFALAQDMANAQIQGSGTVQTGVNVSATERYPGVKDGALANQIAWRELRTLSYPLAKATLVVDRSFWDVTPGDVIAWTDADRGLIQLPLRIQKIDYGQLNDGRIQLDVVQDVFAFQAGAFAAPGATNWVPPSLSVSAFPSAQQRAFEAPRGFVFRDPNFSGAVDKIWATARRQSAEVSFKIVERHASGAPSGAFTEQGEVFALIPIGTLKVDLAAGTAIPTSSILLLATPDSQSTLEAAFTDNPDLVDQGTNLLNLILIDDEFMLVAAASNSGADVNLTNVYRGVLDSAQVKHLANAPVYLIFQGGGLADNTIAPGQNVDVKLLPRSLSAILAEGSATTISFAMDYRLQRPYPPSRLSLNTSVFPSTASLDFLASGAAETTGMQSDFIRRDYRTAEGQNEITALTTDAATLFPTFPANNNTTVEIEVRNDPDGTNTLLFTETGISAATKNLLRLKILRFNSGTVPTRMRLVLKERHDEGSQTGLLSRQGLTFDFNTTSAALSGKFNFGALAQNVDSNNYTATVNGTYNFTLSSSFSSGNVEFRINAGAWTTLIAAGLTTGFIVGVVATDVIEVRHTSAVGGSLKQLDMDAPGAGQDGYAVLYV